MTEAGEFELSLKLNDQNRITSLHGNYFGSVACLREELDDFCTAGLDQLLSTVLEKDLLPSVGFFFNIPQLLLKRASLMIFGILQSKFENEKLYCRCFGVTAEDIEKATFNGTIKDLVTLGQQTRAGIGCGKCSGDCMEVVRQTQFKLLEKKTSSP